MAIETLYHCDRCKATQSTDEQMWTIAVTCDAYSMRQRNQYATSVPRHQRLWCCECVDELQVFGTVNVKDPLTPIPQAVSIEDLIREIAREEAEEIVSNSRG